MYGVANVDNRTKNPWVRLLSLSPHIKDSDTVITWWSFNLWLIVICRHFTSSSSSSESSERSPLCPDRTVTDVALLCSQISSVDCSTTLSIPLRLKARLYRRNSTRLIDLLTSSRVASAGRYRHCVDATQLDVELRRYRHPTLTGWRRSELIGNSCSRCERVVESSCVGVTRHLADATQLDVQLSCVAINGPLGYTYSLAGVLERCCSQAQTQRPWSVPRLISSTFCSLIC